MNSLTMTMSPERGQTRILLLNGQTEVMKAVLGPASLSHPRAAATLLEGLALWHQSPLSVVLVVDEQACSSGLALCDGLGFGQRTVHYDVAVAIREHRRRERRLTGMGDFRDLRRVCSSGGVR
jgi:hypothetical protein